MQKFIGALLLLVIMLAVQTNVFAASLNCTFKDAETKVEGIETLELNEEALIVNDSEVISLEHTKIKCGAFGKQDRFDGLGKRLQIILKSCTDEAVLEGQLLDTGNQVSADVVCN